MLAFASTAHGEHPDPRIERVESELRPLAAYELGKLATLEERMRAYGVPGVGIAIVDNGRVAWAKGYGVADSLTGRKVTAATRFQAASISKPVSALGALLLVQRGRLSLDETIDHGLRSWRIPQTATDQSRVTLRMLLTHTAGLSHENARGGAPFEPGDQLPTITETLAGTSPARAGPVVLSAPPGERFEYSAAGYEVLQQLVVDVSGMPFDEYMRREVFIPLDMSHSSFEQPLPDRQAALAATGHYAGGTPLRNRFRVSPELAVAGLWTTPGDLARYMVGVQKACEGNGKLLRAELACAMIQPDANQRGLGPAISGTGEGMRFGHDGFNEGFEASFTAYVRGGRGAVVMANSGFSFMLIKEILDTIARVYEWPEYGPTTQQPPSASLPPQRIMKIRESDLAGAVGVYVAEGWLSLRLHADADRLFLEWPGFGHAEIFATADGRLFCPQLTFSDVGSPWLRFVRDEKGLIVGLLADDDGSVELRRAGLPARQ